MIVLDAHAVLAPLKGEPSAVEVVRLLARHEQVTLTALGLAEVVDHLVRLIGDDEDDAVGNALRAVAASDLELADRVADARANGRTWTQIAAILGVSKQAARERFGEPAHR